MVHGLWFRVVLGIGFKVRRSGFKGEGCRGGLPFPPGFFVPFSLGCRVVGLRGGGLGLGFALSPTVVCMEGLWGRQGFSVAVWLIRAGGLAETSNKRRHTAPWTSASTGLLQH